MVTRFLLRIACVCRNMPEIDKLMEEWPPEFEELLKEVVYLIVLAQPFLIISHSHG